MLHWDSTCKLSKNKQKHKLAYKKLLIGSGDPDVSYLCPLQKKQAEIMLPPNPQGRRLIVHPFHWAESKQASLGNPIPAPGKSKQNINSPVNFYQEHTYY
jgi:hypothetical protein